MRTLYFRIILTFVVVLVFCSVSTLWVSARISRRATGEFFRGSTILQLQQARHAYEAGGSAELKTYLSEVDAALSGRRYLTDADGRDLVSGTDRSATRTTELNMFGVPKLRNGHVTIIEQSSDGKYRLITVARPPIGGLEFLPYFVILLLVTAATAWGLSAGIVSPLLKMSAIVERFGRGDLSARIETDRKDEIGGLSSAFNNMADRIQTLLTAERRLLQDVSHELRSPLARLSFATELLRTSDDREAAVARVRRESERLTRLVSTLIGMTGAEGDPGSRRHEHVTVSKLLEEIVDDCAIEASARKTHIDSEIKCAAAVEGDPELLRRAVENVLRNSIRYSPPDAPVRIRMDEFGENVVITVRDEGPGVPEEQLARIFEPFYRVEDSRDPATGGIGLGLSIARRAVLVHQGTIGARNASPGLEVKITIPRSAVSA